MMKRILFLMLALLSLNACTEMEYASHLAKGPNATSNRDAYLAQQGNFKIGKPYTVLGQTYIPQETYEYLETGIASWYGPGFHGSRTASGEKYDQHEMTAAHRTLQMPSLVRVTNLDNGRSVIVRVNDRGPFAKGRVMDVSQLAAKNLGMIGAGTAKVKLELLPLESRAIAAAARNGMKTNGVEIVMNDTGRLPNSYNQYMAQQGAGSYQVASTMPVAPPPAPVYAATASGPVPGHLSQQGQFYPDPVVTQQAVTRSNIYIQAGAFGQQDNALRLAQRLGSLAPAKVEPVYYNGRTLYKVKLGPLDSVSTADNVLNRVLASGQSDAIIVVQ